MWHAPHTAAYLGVCSATPRVGTTRVQQGEATALGVARHHMWCSLPTADAHAGGNVGGDGGSASGEGTLNNPPPTSSTGSTGVVGWSRRSCESLVVVGTSRVWPQPPTATPRFHLVDADTPELAHAVPCECGCEDPTSSAPAGRVFVRCHGQCGQLESTTTAGQHARASSSTASAPGVDRHTLSAWFDSWTPAMDQELARHLACMVMPHTPGTCGGSSSGGSATRIHAASGAVVLAHAPGQADASANTATAPRGSKPPSHRRDLRNGRLPHPARSSTPPPQPMYTTDDHVATSAVGCGAGASGAGNAGDLPGGPGTSTVHHYFPSIWDIPYDAVQLPSVATAPAIRAAGVTLPQLRARAYLHRHLSSLMAPQLRLLLPPDEAHTAQWGCDSLLAMVHRGKEFLCPSVRAAWARQLPRRGGTLGSQPPDASKSAPTVAVDSGASVGISLIAQATPHLLTHQAAATIRNGPLLAATHVPSLPPEGMDAAVAAAALATALPARWRLPLRFVDEAAVLGTPASVFMALLSSCVGDRSSETALFVPCRRSVVSVSAARPVVVPNSRLLRHGAASTRNSASEANGGDVCTRLLSAEEGCHPSEGADCPRAQLVTTTAREQLEALGRCVGIALRCGAPLPWCFDPVLMKLIVRTVIYGSRWCVLVLS